MICSATAGQQARSNLGRRKKGILIIMAATKPASWPSVGGEINPP
jgi:hypothetical protein